MHRLPADAACIAEEFPVLSDAAARHLRAIRPREGERVELFDGRGTWREFSWSAGRLRAAGEVRSALRRGRGLVLIACVTKGSRWDWTVEKATELGATRIVPVLSERTVVRIPPQDRAAKRDRWTRVAEDAARQCDAKWLPDVDGPVGFAEAAALAAECECYVGALATPRPQDILSAVMSARHDAARPLALFTGPEGDFSPAELSALLDVATPASFGPAILRAETAAIYGLSVLKAFLDSETA